MPKLRQIIFITLAVLGLAITVGYYRFELDRIAQIRTAINKSENVLQQKRETVQEYREKVKFYKTDEGAAHLAREQYNLVEEGERIILLRSPDEESKLP